ncbi:MAG TPA: hypothetical protein VGG38_14485 [Acidimicrobiales bacterium]
MPRVESIALRSWVALSVLLGLSMILAPESVGAAGNPSLATRIISDPFPHGVREPASYVNGYVAELQQVENAIAKDLNGASVSVAAEGWQASRGSKRGVLVSLIALQQQGVSKSALDNELALGANASAVSFCTASTGLTPFLERPVATIPNSHFAVCGPVKGTGTIPETITTWRANVIALIQTSSATFTGSQIENMALRQYDELGTKETVVISTKSKAKSKTALIAISAAGIALVVVVMAFFLTWRRRRRRRNAPPAGWYESSNTPGQHRYWNGKNWEPGKFRAGENFSLPGPAGPVDLTLLSTPPEPPESASSQ